ncbi:transposase domain-containing protein [Marinicrinis sediminis]|uniref:Transposase domain-containing protein n=1 Tax=Marinicrinis sediminis TaxID=1652465 RepID=A0ABW5RA19_9BACL
MINSIIETAKENGLNPMPYLAYLFESLPQLTDLNDPEAFCLGPKGFQTTVV